MLSGRYKQSERKVALKQGITLATIKNGLRPKP